LLQVEFHATGLSSNPFGQTKRPHTDATCRTLKERISTRPEETWSMRGTSRIDSCMFVWREEEYARVL